MNTLAEIRQVWEVDLIPLCVIDQIEHQGNVLVVLSREHERYNCHRYFPISGHWQVSADLVGCTINDAFKWIEKNTSEYYKAYAL